MSGSRAAIRYANALLQKANENSLADVVFSDMQSVVATLNASHELYLALKSPIIKMEDKQEILKQVFSKVSGETQSLIRVLSENKRTALLGEVAQGYINLYNDAKGVKTAKVITACALSEVLEGQIRQKIEALTGSKEVTLDLEIDPEIIGGFVLRIGDLQYNASVANQLSQIKREFSKSV